MRLSLIIVIGFALIIFFSIVVSYINYKLTVEVTRNSQFLTQSESIIRNSSNLHKSMIEMQSGFRGFLLTGNEIFLQSFYSGLHDIPPTLKDQISLIKNSQLQKEKLDSIIKLHEEWIIYAKTIIGAKKKISNRQEDFDEYQYLFENKLQKEVGKKINDKIAQKFKEFDRNEYKRRQARREILNSSIHYSKNVSLLMAIVIIIIGIVCAAYISKLISKRILDMVSLADKIAKGEFKIIEDKGDDELTNLSHSLNLMSENLSKSFTELESKNKELDQFAYVVSHDLKAPLRGLYNILLWIEEDLDQELSDQLKKYLMMMKGRVERLERLISGLLEFARIGRVTHQQEVVDLNLLLEDIREIIPTGIKFIIKKTMPVLTTEKIRLEQVFTNLISNAVKYSQKSNGTITIDYEDKNRFFLFSVTDDGVGIAQEYHEKIFEIFQTLRQKNEVESTGIGLSIVKKIIEDQKGEIKVISSPMKGATFAFTWPKEPLK